MEINRSIVRSFVRFGGQEVREWELAQADIVVMPLPYEKALSYGLGASDGPFHLLNASTQLEALDEETLICWADLKIHTASPCYPDGEPENAVMEMKGIAADILSQRKRLLCLGGDHSISIGPIMAAADAFENLGVLQVDAHLDLREEWNGSRFNHACVMRRVIEDLGLPVVPVGIRAVAQEEIEVIRRKGIEPFWAHDLSPGENSWIEQVVERLPENVYLSVDLDGLDPSVVPGTGTPEPGGLTYRQVVSLIKAVGKRRRVVAADITELSKIPDSQVSEFTAARIAAKIFVHCWPDSKSGSKSESDSGSESKE